MRPRRPETPVHGPEMVGHALREIVEVPTGDFQDPRLWRAGFASLEAGLVEAYHRPVLVPMTLVDPAHAGEFFSARPPKRSLGRSGSELTPDAPEQDQRIRRWCKDRIEPCMAGADTLPSDTVVLDGELTPRG